MSAVDVVLLALAGGLGAVLRHLLAKAVPSPWGILGVNVAGSFAAGVCSGLLPGPLVTIVAVGLLGGFTTFSTAAVDSVEEGRRRGLPATVAHALGGLAVCVLAAWLGRLATTA